MPLVKSNLGIGLIPEPMAQSGDVYILKLMKSFQRGASFLQKMQTKNSMPPLQRYKK